MARWTIYGADGTEKVLTDSLELHDEWMAECFVTVTVKSAEPIDFAVGDYIDYRDERYTIQYDPTVVKKARKDTYGEGFIYDNIKFVGRQDEIVRCDFTDIVLSDNEMHYTGLPTFPFYCGTVDDLLDRIQANLDELYKDKQAADKWVIISPDYTRSVQRGTCVGREQIFIRAYEKYIGSGTTFTYDKISIPLTANNNTCWDALKWVNEQFGLNFIVRDNVVIVGTAGAVAGSTFKYGKGNGLYEIERIGDSEQDIITRIRAYGNETNIPNRYYANLNLKCFADVTAISSDGTYYEIDLEYSTSYFKQKDTEGNHYVTKIQNGTSYTICYILAYNHSEVFDTGTKAALFPSYGTTFTVGQRLYFIEGINENTWPSSNKEQSEKTLPDNMSVTRLMLPGFPLKSLRQWVNEQVAAGNTKVKEIVDEGFTFSDEKYRPYIESPNKDVYGVRPSSVYFDGSNEFDDIHPTIKGMQYAGIDVDKVSSAQQITDNGVLADEHQESDEYVTITIPEAGFDLGAYLTDEAAIEMVDGMCGGRSLKIKKVTTDDSRRSVCTCVRDYDDTLKLYFPYNDFNISSGDHFVLTGIDLPDSYIEAASERLFFASVSALRDNDSPSFTFQPRIDEIWMARQNDIAEGSSGKIKSLHDTLKAGDIFSFTDEDLGIDAQIIIDILTIKENGNNGIPTYEVTLRNEKVTSSIDRKIQKITSSGSGGMGSGGGISTRQTAGLIEAQGGGLFLSKIYDDVANGLIGFMKGAWFGAKKWFIDDNGKANLKQVMSDTHITSNYTGDGMFDTGGLFQYLNGKAKLVVDQVVCRGKFVVNEIEDRIWTYSGGNLIFSAAGSTIFYVEYLGKDDRLLGYTEINSPWLLSRAPLLASIYAWAKRRTVQRSLTTDEKSELTKFRCYETSDDGTMQTRNWWHVDDIAYCQTLNRVKDKTESEEDDNEYTGTFSNTVYARRVVGIGSKKIDNLDDEKIYDYVDLSFSDCDPDYNDWPAAGDVIVQRGNFTNKDRQGFTTVEVTGTQRGVKVYDTVNDYTMEGKKQAFLGYDADKNRAQLEVFGDAYIGAYGDSDPHEGKTYVRYDAKEEILEIKAKISAESSIGSMNFDEYINGLITNITDAIEKQVDKKAETWYQATDPSKEWKTEEENAEHVGDLWYCTDDTGDFGKGTTWYYKKDGSSYAWEEQFIPKSVFDTLDGKASVYISRPSSYKAKDLWILAEETTLNKITYKKGEMLTATTDSDTFVEAHWVKKVIYTDDSALNNFVDVTYALDKRAFEVQIDGQIETFFKKENPATEWTTDKQKESHLYDVWYVTENSDDGEYKKGQLFRYKLIDGTYKWEEIHDEVAIQAYQDASTAQDTADGKRRVFVTTPVPPYDEGDLWTNANFTNDDVTYSDDLLRCNNSRETGPFSISDWERASKYTDDSAYLEWLAGDYADDIAGINNSITQNAGDIELAKAKAQMAEQVCTDIKNALTKYAADGKISKVEQSHIKNLTDGEDVTKDKLLNDISIYGLDDQYASELTSAWNNFVTARDKYAVVQDEDITVDDTYSYFAAYYDKYVEIRQLITKQGYDVANEANNKAEALNYIKKALGQKTDIDGGLILTSLIALRDDEGKVWSGINGIYQGDEEKGIFGNGIAAWFGGQMIDHDAYPKKDNYAKILFRMDGTGYMAGGNISWDSDGAGKVAGGNITWDKDGNVEIKGNSLTATEKIYLGEKDVTAFFEMFELEGSGTTEDPYVIKANYGLYSESFISALGNGGSGSGGGGAQYLSQLQDVQMSGTPTSGQVLTYNGTKWVNGEGGSGGLDVDAMWNELTSPGNKQIDSSHINFSGYMKTTDNAVTATKLKNTFAITIGGTAHNVDGSESVSWTLADIGAASATDVTTLQGYFDEGSAKSAKKLASEVKIWGRDFDGSGEIKGAIENATTISASSDVSVGGKLTVEGASTMSSTLTVSKLITANGGVTIPSAASLKIGDATISWDSENECVKIDKGFYSDSFISALGAGFDSGANVLKEPLRSINNTLNSNPTESNVGLVWDGTKWAFGKTGGSDMDSVWSSLSTADSSKQIDVSHLSTALSGYVTTSQLGNYLPKTGGSMSGAINMNGNDIKFQGSDPGDIVWYDTNGNEIERLWSMAGAGSLYFRANGGTAYQLIHTGNIGSQTVSNADTVDGHHDGDLSARYISVKTLTSSDTLDDISDGFYHYVNKNYPTNSVGDNSALIQIRSRIYDRFQLAFAGNSNGNIYYRSSHYETASTWEWDDWKTIITSGNISTQTVSKATNCLYLDGTNSMSGNISFASGYSINDLHTIHPASANSDLNHSLYFGYSGKNTVRWHEYGGVWDFYSGESSGEASGTLEVTLGSTNYFHGKVGIGNDDPTYKLDLIGDDAFRMLSENRNTGVAIVTNDAQLAFHFLRKYESTTLEKNLNSFTSLISIAGNASALALVVGNRDSIPTAINGGDYIQFTVGRTIGAGMRLDSSGNLGIGNSSPSYKLDVNGYVYASGYVTSVNSSSYVLLTNGSSEALSNLTVGKADRLSGTNPCSAWGVEYWANGVPKTISGNMTGVGDIQMDSSSRIYSSGNIYLGDSSNSYHVYCANLSGKYTASGTAKWSLDSDDGSFDCGNITCDDITGDDATFDNVLSKGYVTALSDIRKKDVQEYFDMSVEDIAKAPLIRFKWNDKEDDALHVGSVAQYWQTLLPEAVIEGKDGTLSMDYAVIALSSSVATARRVMQLEQRIKELEDKLKLN